MNRKVNINLVTAAVFLLFILVLAVTDVAQAPTQISLGERRQLAQFPEVSWPRITSGDFTEDYQTYLQDQMAFRDGFRSVKSFVERKIMLKKENNGVYVVDNNIYDKFWGINQPYIERASRLINELADSIDAESTYLSIIPTKANLLNPDRYLLSDQNIITDFMAAQTQTDYIDLMGLFQAGDTELYYVTDHHWTTPGAIEAYTLLAAEMGLTPVTDYTYDVVTDAFAGRNYGKAAVASIGKDSILLAHNQSLDNLTVRRYKTLTDYDASDSVYFPEYAEGLDPYDVFLGGAGPIIVIENSAAASDAELVIFKDSYAHSLAPFLAQHYRKVTLLDLRYVRKELLIQNFEFGDKTVLFLYSTTILNTTPQILN
jgi:hypothetical protein